MTKIEKSVIDFIERNIKYICFIVVFIIGVLIRYLMRDGMSGDMNVCLLPWFEEMERGGVDSLGKTIGNYNVPYVIIMTLLTYLPFNPMYMIKMVSIVFDLLLAGACAYLVKDKIKDNLLVFTGVFLSPVVMLNSAWWGQCDSVYVAFLLFTLVFVKQEKWIPAFIMYGIAFAFKLQAIFLMPFLVVLYFRKKSFSLFHFLIVPVVNFTLCLPAVIMGRPIKDIVMIYISQTSAYQQMTMNYPNMYAILPFPYEGFHTIALLIALTVLGIGAYLVIKEKCDFNIENSISSVIWSVWSCVLFMPAMHERYGYLMEILFIVYAIVWKKKVVMCCMVNFITLCTYCNYLFGNSAFNMNMLAIINIIMYILYTIDIVKQLGVTQDNESIKL